MWQDGSSPLHYAAAFGQTHVLETLIKAGIAVDSRDDACNTPLHLAAGLLLHRELLCLLLQCLVFFGGKGVLQCSYELVSSNDMKWTVTFCTHAQDIHHICSLCYNMQESSSQRHCCSRHATQLLLELQQLQQS